jgi:hypothetical protein
LSGEQVITSGGFWAGVVIGFCMLFACSGDSVSVVMPAGDLHLRYNDANVESTDPEDYPQIEDGDTLYSILPWGSNGVVLFILWPPSESDCIEHLSLDAIVAGSAELVTSRVCEVDTVGTDTVQYTCDLGVDLGFWIYTAEKDTSAVLALTFRVCCEDGGCLAWSKPISFTVIDTLSRSP